MYGNAFLTAGCLSVLLAGGIKAQERGKGDIRIGVYDVNRAGGQGSAVGGIVRGLKRQGWWVETFEDLSLMSLIQYDIVYLSDMHKPGPSPKNGRRNISAYVEAGGSVLQTWHHHILGPVSTGVKRIYGKRGMIVKAGHPAVAGVQDFRAAYRDHIIEKVGPEGTVIIENEAGQPVAVAGKMGKGKVISTGLSLNIPGANPLELKLTGAFFNWLKPDVPKGERMGVLREPQLVVSPEEALVPAGLPMTFRLMAGPVKEGQTCRVLLDGKPVQLLPTDPGSTLRKAEFLLTAPAGRDSESDHELVVDLAGRVLSRRFSVKGIFAPAPANEKRGVWLHVGRDRHPSVVMPELRKLGINMAVLRIAGGTAAFYASKVQPDVQDPLAEEGGDWLADAVKYAHANGIEIHPYVNNCVVEGRTSPESLQRLREQGRLQEGPDGHPIDWFCPSQPDNLAAVTRPMVEIAADYDIDGIQYDFIRYPNSQGCFCAKCRALFEKETGESVGQWPKDALEGGARHDAYIEFRCERISAIVKHVSTEIRRVNPKARISAAVFRNWPECRISNGQDWARWCKEGWLDFVCPMTYTTDAAEYQSQIKVHREAVPVGFPIVEGLGIASGSGKMDDPGKAALHIILARKAGASGFCGFCYRPGDTTPLLEPLTKWLDHPAAGAE